MTRVGMMSRAVRIQLFTARVLYRVSYRVTTGWSKTNGYLVKHSSLLYNNGSKLVKITHIKLKNKPNDLTKHYYNCENITDCYNLRVNRHRNLFLKL